MLYCCLCGLCGRPVEQATVTIGGMPVGPRCAARAGLLELGRKEVGAVRLAVRRKTAPRPKTGDLFEAMA